MKKFLQIAAVLGCVVTMGGFLMNAANAQAADLEVKAKAAAGVQKSPLDAFTIAPEKMRASGMLRMRGHIAEISGNSVLIKGEGNQSIVAMLDSNTYIIEGAKGKLRMPRALKAGQEVFAYYSARMTRSLPPQTKAFALVLGSQEEYLPQYFVVDQVQHAADGSFVRVLNSTNDLIATITADACEKFADIQVGDKLLVWSRMMTMSLPGMTNAEKVVILP